MNCTNKYFYIRRVFRTDCMMPKRNHKVDFGVKFLAACNKFLQQNNRSEAHLEVKKSKKDVCLC